MAKRKDIRGRVLFVFTDNFVFESTFYKGHSSSPKLTEIIFRLREIERLTGAILHVIHIAGTRMMESGIDGLSRGDFLTGIMKGRDPLEFVPLNLDAGARSQGRVQAWIRGWWKERRPFRSCRLRALEPASEGWKCLKPQIFFK